MSDWTRRISQITPLTPVPLDDELEKLDPRFTGKGTHSFPPAANAPEILTPFADPEHVAIGVRITDDTTNRASLAMRLAQMAAEKEAEPVILSYVETTGLERFGFRVERIAGSTDAERQAAEAQVIKFWNIVVVIKG